MPGIHIVQKEIQLKKPLYFDKQRKVTLEPQAGNIICTIPHKRVIVCSLHGSVASFSWQRPHGKVIIFKKLCIPLEMLGYLLLQKN